MSEAVSDTYRTLLKYKGWVWEQKIYKDGIYIGFNQRNPICCYAWFERKQ